ASCCSSSVAPGGTYNRINDARYPATVSSFALDTYEITVGRFRRFVMAYSQSMTAAGAGKNPKNATDSGWDIASNTSLPADAAALQTAVACNEASQTWTPSPGSNENLPMNCINWYEAFAFCIWDGGRLPTEAEWNYAAAGGSEQRAYPWGAATPDCTYANYRAASGGCPLSGTGVTLNVGSQSPKGNGKWGHADLGGNVIQWTLDSSVTTYTTPCQDCAATFAGTNRAARGASFYDTDTSSVLTSRRLEGDPTFHDFNLGSRCARSP
ncbi:MAG TPA: SUMF1/EgtB/PvdO family nonheme iron enzyme, partial [Polyangiaceae bacterium]